MSNVTIKTQFDYNDCARYGYFEDDEYKYTIYLLDGVYLCSCSIKYNRKLSTICKHIKYIKNELSQKLNND